MFLTESDHELFLPTGLDAAGTRHWRVVRLPLHAAWFVLTVEVTDGDVSFVRTACIAWDTDLVDVLESIGDARAVGLLCMIPGWCSPTGQWAAREVKEVWLAGTSAGGRVVILHDEYGHEFRDQSRAMPSQELVDDRRLILRLESSSGRRVDAKPSGFCVREQSRTQSEAGA